MKVWILFSVKKQAVFCHRGSRGIAMNIMSVRFISLTMEKESIAYFYLQYGQTAKKHIFSRPQMSKNHIEREGMSIDAIGVPEFYRTKKAWKEKILEKELLAELEKSGAQWCWYGEVTARFLGVKQPEIPFFFMEEMLFRYGVRERVILIGEPNPLFDLVFQNFMPKVNYLQISCNEPEMYEERIEWLYETFGIVTAIQRGRAVLTGNGQAETLVIDMERGKRPDIDVGELLGKGIYMDMGSCEEKKIRIIKRNRNIRYLSPESLLNKWCHLDTNVQNGYNTRVN